jgi:hypothetical protein
MQKVNTKPETTDTNAEPVLTGQQWYAKFMAELEAYPSDEEYPSYVIVCARRAAGLVND